MVAMPVYQERISPLLDVAKKFVIFELESGEIRQKLIIDIHAEADPFRIEKLREIGVSVIISGAVSGVVSRMINERGIRLISWVNGPVDDVIELYIRDALRPYCPAPRGCGRKRRQREGRIEVLSDVSINGSKGEEKP